MSSLPVFSVSVEPLDDACVVRAVGEIDMSTVGRLRAPLEAARADGVTTLLDLSGVSFIDSRGLHLLLDAARAVERSEWAFFVVRPSAVVRRLIDVSRSAPRLPIVATHWSGVESPTATRPSGAVVRCLRPSARVHAPPGPAEDRM